jgi:hypothetical protein
LWRWRGWEIFPLGQERFKTYLYSVNRGEEEIISLGKKIVDSFPPVKDTFAPEIKIIQFETPTSISIEFNEEVDPATAEDRNNYQINGAAVRNIGMGKYPNMVDLFTDSLEVGTNCSITVQEIHDLTGNTITPASMAYTVPVHPPAFNIASGLYYNEQQLEISAFQQETQIRYTTDGTEPASTSILYDDILIIDSTVVVKARAFKQGFAASDVSDLYVELKVPAPAINLQSDVYAKPQEVLLRCDNEKAVIRYTIDRSEPSEKSTVYRGPLQVTETTLIKAKAFINNWETSNESFVYIIIFDESGNRAFSRSVQVEGTLEERKAVVKMANQLFGQVEINVLNRSGRILQSFEFEKNHTLFSEELNKLRFGTFLLEISVGNNKTYKRCYR